MSKPTQPEFDVARTVLEYMAASTMQHEPYAVHTIEDIESVLGNSFDAADWEDAD